MSNRASVALTPDWSVRPDLDLPPLPLLLASAPRLNFSDLLLLENRKAPAVLQFAVSDNPFLGSDARKLDTHMHERLVKDLFYFFFPPPRACLAGAKTSFEQAKHREQERLEKEKQESKSKEPAAPARPIRLPTACDFFPTPLDFYASQISSGVVFFQTQADDRVEGQFFNFYLPPMEQVEIGGKTFFIFEARSEHALERAEIEKFGLPDDLRGSRAFFFWAIGANSPFPFLRDPNRKDLQLIHIVYACLSFDGNARAEFRELLDRVAFEP